MKKSVHAGISYFAIHSYIEYAPGNQFLRELLEKEFRNCYNLLLLLKQIHFINYKNRNIIL